MKKTTFNRDKIIAEVFGYDYYPEGTPKSIIELATVLQRKIRDTENNRIVAESMLPLKDILPNWKNSVLESIDNGLTVAEKEKVTELNGSINEWRTVAIQCKADAKSLREQAREKELKAVQALEKVAEAEKAIASVYEEAGLKTVKPKTTRARKADSSETDDEKRQRQLEYKREWNRKHREALKAAKTA